ncbi:MULTISPECIES: hypothetical protein [unclassified Streptomyces]|uniref:hypothetical protein n=1 Tax=unclassified Streptomyces TaxID=2593676 RepID=UPI000DB9DC74|nr:MULTISPECIES: hypothetical protein [unclassified Streptomyces]MYT73803.1 hypothetical protein [Streptomyces sp. SID8367]RAJ89215.1 hypothetical protein K377_01340 [Streptomyces sp. PsTaAH-137]
MPRPGDWNALRMDSDPTPGDPVGIDEVIASQGDLVTLADVIDKGLTEVRDTSGGAFVGKTGDALRKIIDDDLRKYVTSFRQAQEDARSALRTYAGVMREQQRRADDALSQASALAEDDDAGRDAHKATADDAKDILEKAAQTAASALETAAESIASPIDECEEIWKALGWLALILVIPAILVGGPVALFAIALNVALLIKTAVDFANGNASVTDLIMSILGVIAPTTKGLKVGQLWSGLKGLGTKGFAGGKNLLTGGPNALGLFGRLTLGIDDSFKATSVWLNGLKGMKGFGGLHFSPGLNGLNGLKGLNGLRFDPATLGKSFGFFPAAVDLMVINMAGAKSFFGLRALATGINGIKGFGSGMANGLSGLKGLRLFLPVAADEMGGGLALAMKIGFIDRGIFGMYRYGAFVNGEFIGAASKVSGGVASGFTLFTPGTALTSLPHIGLGGMATPPTRAAADMGVNIGNVGLHGVDLPSMNLVPSGGLPGFGGGVGNAMPVAVNFGSLPQFGVSFDLAPPSVGTKIVDIPSVGALGVSGGGLNMPLPTLGPVQSISAAPDVAGLTPGAAPAVGAVSVPSVSMPGLGSTATPGIGAVSAPAVSTPQVGAVAGLGSVPHVGAVAGGVQLPSLGAITPAHSVAFGGNMVPGGLSANVPNVAPAISSLNAPALHMSSTNLTHVDLPSLGSQITDLPSATGLIGREGLTVPVGGLNAATTPISMPALSHLAPGAAHLEVPPVTAVSTGGLGGAPSVNLAPPTAPAVNIANLTPPSVTGAVVSPPAVNTSTVSVPSVGGVSASGVGHIAAPGVSGAAVTPPAVNGSSVSVPSVGGVNASGVGHIAAPSVTGAAVTPPAVNTSAVSVPSVGGVGASGVGHVASPSVTGAAVTPPAVNPSTAGGVAGAASGAGHLDTPSFNGAAPGAEFKVPAGDLHTPGGQTADLHTTSPVPNGSAAHTVDVPTVDAHGAAGTPAIVSPHVAPTPLPATAAQATPPVTAPAATGVPSGTHVEVPPAVQPTGGNALGKVAPPALDGSSVSLAGLNALFRGDDVALTPPATPHTDALGTGNATGDLTRHAPGPLDALAGFGAGKSVFHQDIRVGMVQVSYDLQHTFTNIPHLPGVRVDVTPAAASGDGRLVDVTVRGNGSTDVRTSSFTQGDQRILRLEYDLPHGDGIRRLDFALDAAQGHRLITEEVIDVHVTGGSGTEALEMVPGGSGGLTGLGSSAGHAVVPALPVPAPLTVHVPGLTGVDLQVTAAADGARPTVTVTGAPAGHPVTAWTEQGTDGLTRLHAEWTRGVRSYRSDFTFDGTDYRFTGGEQTFALRGGHFGDSTVVLRLDAHNAPLSVRHLGSDGLPLGGGPVRLVDNGLHVPTPNGFQTHSPTTGLPTHDGLRLQGAGAEAAHLHVVGPHGGGAPLTLTDDMGAATGGTVTAPADGGGVYHVNRTGTGGLVDVHGADGAFSHQALPVTGGGLDGAFVRPADGPHGTPTLVHSDGRPFDGASVTALDGGGFRVEHGGQHLVLDAGGVHTHDAVRLTGPGGQQLFAHVPVGGHNPVAHPFTATGTPVPATNLVRHGDTLHLSQADATVTVHDVRGGDPLFTALPVHGGGLGGSLVRFGDDGLPTGLVRPDATPVHGAGVTALTGGGFRIEDGAVHIAVDVRGAVTHDVVTLRGPHGAGADTFAFTRADGTLEPHPRTGLGTDVAGHGVVRTPTGTFHVTDARGDIRVHGANGTHSFDATALHVPGLNNRLVGTVPGTAGPQLLDGTLAPVGGGHVVPQTGNAAGGFRVEDGAHHVLVDAAGDLTHQVVRLGGRNDRLAMVPAGGGLPHAVRGADGAPVPNTTLTPMPGNELRVTDATTVTVHAADGTTRLEAVRLADGTGARGTEHLQTVGVPAPRVLDAHLQPLAGHTVETLTTGEFRVTATAGDVRLFGAGGDLRATIRPADGHGLGPHVTDGVRGTTYDLAQLSDVRIGTPNASRYLVTTDGLPRVVDGNLQQVPGVQVVAHGTEFRVTDGPGARGGEFRTYEAGGRLSGERIVSIHKGAAQPNRHYDLTYPADGSTGTWQLVKQSPAGAVLPHNDRAWFESGTIGAKGLDNGRVSLVSHSGNDVYERRPLQGGTTLYAFHGTGGAGDFARTSQRGTWAEVDAGGTVVRHGTRHWGESGRSWFDVRSVNGLDVRVRHFQLNPDGGHVLGTLDNHPATQSLATGTWHRYDDTFQHLAQGTRDWGPGRGFTDRMPDPNHAGRTIVVHEKFGRFQASPHDVRRYFQLEMNADGTPKTSWVTHSPQAKETGAGKDLANGSTLEVQRLAEQRPPVNFRRFMTFDYRTNQLEHAAPWLAGDSRLQVARWTQTPAGGGAPVSGIRFTSMDSTVTDIATTPGGAHVGEVVRETRKLGSGNDLKTGDVALPTTAAHAAGVPPQPNHLPWSEGDGKLQGTRTYVNGEFQVTPGNGGRTTLWQDQFHPTRQDADWYTHGGAGDGWHVARTGLDDGSMVEFRPRPAVRPDGAAGSGDRNFRVQVHSGTGDWTRFDHQGFVLSRSDTWPTPNGAGTVEIRATGHADGTHFTWTDAHGTTGTRYTAQSRDVDRWGWDKESYQDFDNGGLLLREHRVLSDGDVVDAWRVSRDVHGVEVWNWNKIDRHGNIKDFGTGQGDRVRTWYDGNTALTSWKPGARWQDSVTSLGHDIQVIPVKQTTGAVRSFFTDQPFRVREYTANPGDAFNAHVWKEFDTGVVVREKKLLTNNTFLESEEWGKHWRQYAADGTTVINERSMSGYVWNTDAFGRTTLLDRVTPDWTHTPVGRETNFTGLANEYRGFSRMLREPNRWKFGPSVAGEATYAPFLSKAFQQLAVEMGQEWIVDFVLNLAVYGIASAVTGQPFTPMDVAKAAFGATIAAGSKGVFTTGHLIAGRGGAWKNGLSNVDAGKPYGVRPNDDSWGSEWAGNEKVMRWRSGIYDFANSSISGAVGAFASGAATAAVFGVKDADGNTVYLSGADAAAYGGAGALGGFIGGSTIGAARTLMQNNIAGRWYHRQGVMDIFVMPAIGKMIDKSFSTFFFGAQVRDWLGITAPAAPAETGGDGGGTA